MIQRLKKLFNWKLVLDYKTWDKPVWIFLQGPQLPEERRGYYTTFFKEALNIAESREFIHKALMRELVAQDVIAF